jgi:hypothetical protein
MKMEPRPQMQDCAGHAGDLECQSAETQCPARAEKRVPVD